MDAARKIVDRMLDELPSDLMPDVISYIEFVKNRNRNQIFKELEKASLSSIHFWNNTIDDEAWNDV